MGLVQIAVNFIKQFADAHAKEFERLAADYLAAHEADFLAKAGTEAKAGLDAVVAWLRS